MPTQIDIFPRICISLAHQVGPPAGTVFCDLWKSVVFRILASVELPLLLSTILRSTLAAQLCGSFLFRRAPVSNRGEYVLTHEEAHLGRHRRVTDPNHSKYPPARPSLPLARSYPTAPSHVSQPRTLPPASTIAAAEGPLQDRSESGTWARLPPLSLFVAYPAAQVRRCAILMSVLIRCGGYCEVRILLTLIG